MRTWPWSGLPRWLTTTCSRFSLVSPLAMTATRFPPLGCIAFLRSRASSRGPAMAGAASARTSAVTMTASNRVRICSSPVIGWKLCLYCVG